MKIQILNVFRISTPPFLQPRNPGSRDSKAPPQLSALPWLPWLGKGRAGNWGFEDLGNFRDLNLNCNPVSLYFSYLYLFTSTIITSVTLIVILTNTIT